MDDAREHVSEGRLMAHLDGELAGERSAGVAAHLDRCGACRERLRELRQASELVGRSLAAIDVPPPETGPGEIRAASRRPGSSADGTGAPGHGRWRTARRSLLKAAVLVLAVGTAAAAVVPGSPLREWVADAVASWSSDPPSDTGVTAAAPPDTSRESVSIVVDRRAIVHIVEPAPELTVRIRATEGSRLTVAARAERFETGAGSVEVMAPTGPEVVIGLPRGVPSARISVEGRLLLERERGRQTLHAPADTTAGGVRFRLGTSGREP